MIKYMQSGTCREKIKQTSAIIKKQDESLASYVAACGALTDKLSRDISQSLVDMK